MGKVIGICNQKGGTGKTTSSINISAYLGIANKKTLLIDMDPQGNATSGLGFSAEGKKTIYEVIVGSERIENCIYPTHWPQVYVTPSSVSLTGGEIELVSVQERELRLKKQLEKIAQDFAYIIVDAPPSLGLLTVNVFAAVQSLIIPIQAEYYALEGVSQILPTINIIRERVNPALEIEGVVITMADFRTKLTLQVIEEVRNYFKEKTFNTIIPRNVKLAEAPSFGMPIHYYDAQCVGAKAYLRLVEEILKEKITIEIRNQITEPRVEQETRNQMEIEAR